MDYSEVCQMKTSEGEAYFLCVGRLNYQKSFSFAIESFSKFLKFYPDYKLVILGEGELEKDLKKLVKDLDIEESVIFKGFSRDLSSFYANAKATLLTSYFEGFPNVLIESIAHATPVISLDCSSGPSEIIEEGVNGYLIKERSTVAFSEKMVEIVSSSNLNPIDIYNSSRRFCSDKVVEAWVEVLEK